MDQLNPEAPRDDESTVPEETPRGQLVASYSTGIHLRKKEGENLVPLTIGQLETEISQALGALGFEVSVTSERTDR